MMRIITGSAKGARLETLEGEATRPTAERTKQAVFNILQFDVEGRKVLDLFGGSGQMALEALSRGAESAVLIDSSRKAAAAIKRNIELCGAEENTRLLITEWQGALSSLKGQTFTLVFLDPPYRMLNAYADAPARLKAAGLLSEDALIVMEHAREAQLPDLPDGFELTDTRRYGDTCLSMVRLRSESE